MGVKKERGIYNFCSESDFVTVSEWLSGVVRSSVVGSVPVQVISNRWTVLDSILVPIYKPLNKSMVVATAS